LKVVASEFARLDPKDEYQHDPTYTNRIFFCWSVYFPILGTETSMKLHKKDDQEI
jgi:hypothetical protein